MVYVVKIETILYARLQLRAPVHWLTCASFTLESNQNIGWSGKGVARKVQSYHVEVLLLNKL